MTLIPSVNFIPRIRFSNGSGRRSGADFLRGQLRSLLDKRVGDACHHVARAVCRHWRPRSVKKTWRASLPAPVPIWLATVRGSPRTQADAPTAPVFAAVDV